MKKKARRREKKRGEIKKSRSFQTLSLSLHLFISRTSFNFSTFSPREMTKLFEKEERKGELASHLFLQPTAKKNGEAGEGGEATHVVFTFRASREKKLLAKGGKREMDGLEKEERK